MSSSPTIVAFHHAAQGMTRFPPNVERVTVDVAGSIAWLNVSRNEINLAFPLQAADCRHLATLLLAAAAKIEGTSRLEVSP
jgi:hypothetical protein